MDWIRICKAQIQPNLTDTASATRGGLVHTTVGKTLFSDSFCTCEGFLYRGECKHVALQDENYCRWFKRTTEDDTTQVPCPMCGGDTILYTFDLEFDG